MLSNVISQQPSAFFRLALDVDFVHQMTNLSKLYVVSNSRYSCINAITSMVILLLSVPGNHVPRNSG